MTTQSGVNILINLNPIRNDKNAEANELYRAYLLLLFL